MLFTVSKTKRTVSTRVIAVRMHADWCEASQLMDRFYENLKNRFDGQDVLFVSLDYTNNTTRYQSDLLANALGIDEALSPYGETGHIVLMTYRGKQVFGRLTPSHDFVDMVRLIEKKLK